uniref:Protein ABHD15 n=1 Tax=Chrysemys picta bellii TaxID=8478 RepID=A0A8C3I4Z8_CHRPI
MVHRGLQGWYRVEWFPFCATSGGGGACSRQSALLGKIPSSLGLSLRNPPPAAEPWGSLAAWALALALLCLLATELWGPGWGSLLPSHEPGGAGEEDDGDNVIGEEGPGAGRCRLICKSSALAQSLLRSLRRGAARQSGRWLWRTWPQLQTMFQLLFPPARQPELARELLQLADGGLVALDWVMGPRGTGKRSRATTAFGTAPVLLVLPNASGKVTRGVLHLCLLALEQGYKPVIFNRRGHNGSPLASLKLQAFGDPGDLKEAVTYIRMRQPGSSLCAVSEGSGSGLLLSYLGECGSSSYLAAASCISPVFRCQEWLETGCPWLYEWSLLLHQKRGLSRYVTALAEVVETGRLFRSCSLREFEETLFCQTKRHPVTWDAYWDRNDPLREVDEAAVPVLCICSADDPVRGPPASTLPMELFHSSPYFFLLLTPHGGHCGFLREGSCSWSHEVTLEYFTAVAEFFRTEERLKGLHRYRRGVPQKREASSAACHLQEIFSWQRSYTR